MKVLPRRRGAVLVNSALGVALLAGAALAYTTLGSGTSSAAGKTQIRSVTVTKGTVLATVSGSGTLSSPSDAGQDFVTGGKLTSVNVSVGDAVKKGQVLATVDTTAAQQQVDTAQSTLTAADANLTKAEAGVTTTTTSQLPSTGGSGGGSGSGGGGRSGSGSVPAPQTTTITTTKVDDAQVAQAQQQVDSAKIALSNAQAALAGTTLTASADGTVASVSGKVGDTVGSAGGSSSGSGSGSGTSSSKSSSGSAGSSSGSTPTGFIVLTNPSGMQVSGAFSELDSLKLKKGEAATVTLNAQSDTKLNATVLSVSSLPLSSSGSSSAVQYGAVLKITGDTSKLRTGLSATVSVITGEADNALSVPTTALAGTGSTRTATVVHDDGSTARVDVTVGVEGDSTVQVLSGLNEGDKVELASTTAGGSNGFPGGSFPGLTGGGGLGGGGFGGGGGGGGRGGGGGGTGGGGGGKG
ncbi:HlyD family efflux transporter periplasmic adaptor subunit [Kitasatospora kazusensis]|uniref:HlyD family efflux transporter periplasmic adaptor subunit n=1 Tax=Kitasatospora kazusensis TaxID=407974 RepID=A0ABP5KLT4_9ACTN